MRDFAFYNAGCDGHRSWKRAAVVPVRRLLRRILRPIFVRQEQIDHDLQGQIDALAAKVDGLAHELAATNAFGWDHVAMARRLAALEDQVIRLRQPSPAHTSAVPRPHLNTAAREVPR